MAHVAQVAIILVKVIAMDSAAILAMAVVQAHVKTRVVTDVLEQATSML